MALISQTGGGSRKTTTTTKKTTTPTTTKKTTTSTPKKTTVSKPTNTSSAYNQATYTPPKTTTTTKKTNTSKNTSSAYNQATYTPPKTTTTPKPATPTYKPQTSPSYTPPKVTVPKIEVKPTPQVPSTANNSAVNNANKVPGVANGTGIAPVTGVKPNVSTGSGIRPTQYTDGNINTNIGYPSSVSTAQNGGVLNNAGSSINNNFAAVMQDATKVNQGASPSEVKAIQENNKALNQVIAETPGGAQEMLKKGSQGANMYDVINSAIEDYNSQFNNNGNNYGGNTGGNTEQSLVQSQSFYDDLMAAFLEMNEAARQDAIDAILKNLDAVKGTYKDQIQQTIDEYAKLVNQNEVAKDRARRVVKENQANRGQLDSGMGRQERLNLDIGYDNKTADLNAARQQAVNEIYNLIAQAEAEAASNKASINNQYDNAILQWQIANS